MTVSYKELRKNVNRSLSLIDPDVTDMIFGVCMGRRMPPDPVWLVMLGASGSGKTEVLKVIEGAKCVYPVTGITSNALVSGYIQKDAEGNPINNSLLRLLDGKIMLLKDLSEFITKGREEMQKIWGILREAFSGSVHYGFGGQAKMVVIRSLFQMLGACTSFVEKAIKGEDKALGERMIFFKIRVRSALEHFQFVLSVASRGESWRKQLYEQAKEFLDDTKPPTDPAEIHVDFEGIIDMALLAATARSPVLRNQYRGDRVEALPEPEYPARLGMQATRLGSLVQFLGGNGQRVVKRICRSCIPSVRYGVLRRLSVDSNQTAGQMQKGDKPLLVDEEVITQACEELFLLGIVERRKLSQGRGRPVTRYSVRDEWFTRVRLLCGSKWMRETKEEREVREERDDVRAYHEKKAKVQLTKKEKKVRQRAEIVYIEDGVVWPGEW